MGTWLASALIAVGVVWSAVSPNGTPWGPGLSGLGLIRAGVAVFILLPVARVLLMLSLFIRARDALYALLSLLVLLIIALGVVLGR